MITSHRHIVLFLLQVVFLSLLVLIRCDYFSSLQQYDGDTVTVQLSLQSDDIDIECADFDEDSVGSEHDYSPGSTVYFNDFLQRVSSTTGRLYPVVGNNHLPIVYLPVFSPPKITA
ncbi:MAG: hypothetical protein PHI31_05840 [Desulfuromonadaceae bacterium]|nr:hypothetical protein [Desulfuromonadaceae bacterium]